MTVVPVHDIPAERGGQVLSLTWPGTGGTVFLPAASGLAADLSGVLRGWTPRVRRLATGVAPIPGAADGSVTAVTGDDATGFTVASSFLEAPLGGLPRASAVCAVIADLVEGFVDADPRLTGLHCAAFRRGAGPITVLTGAARAGKSTFISRMSAEPGVTVLCDDVLPVDARGNGRALGVAPRLRLPLPATAAPGFRAHVAAHLGLRDDLYGYLDLPGLAAHGSTAPIGTVIVLARQEGARACLRRLERDAAMRFLAGQRIGGVTPAEAEATVSRLARIAGGATTGTLVYSDLEEAVALLAAVTAPDGGIRSDAPLADPLPETRDTAPAPPPLPRDRVLRQAPGLAMRRQGVATWLWRPGAAMLWHLNPLGRAIWILLEEPGTIEEIAATLRDVFPEVPAGTIAADCEAFLASLAQAGLVEPARIRA